MSAGAGAGKKTRALQKQKEKRTDRYAGCMRRGLVTWRARSPCSRLTAKRARGRGRGRGRSNVTSSKSLKGGIPDRKALLPPALRRDAFFAGSTVLARVHR